MLLEWNERLAKPVSRERLHRAADYVIARNFSGAMGVLVADSELSASSFYGIVSCFFAL